MRWEDDAMEGRESEIVEILLRIDDAVPAMMSILFLVFAAVAAAEDSCVIACE